MSRISKYRYFFVCFFVAMLPFIALLFPSIRHYITNNFMVSATYNSVIIIIYLSGSTCALFTIVTTKSASDILNYGSSSKNNSLLSNLNQAIFTKAPTEVDSYLLLELEDGVLMSRTQRLSFIMSCSNVSTLIGLLGTFAGLSITIGSAMNEDDCRIRRGNAAELFSGIRHIAVNILSSHKEFKAGLRRKMRKAAMDRKYLASVLAGCGVS